MVSKSCRGCGRICQGSQCDDCRSARERRRPSSRQRGYNTAYRRLRLKVVEQARHGRPCVICGRSFSPDDLVTAEHILPLRLGGQNTDGNLGPAHAKCNYGWSRKTG